MLTFPSHRLPPAESAQGPEGRGGEGVQEQEPLNRGSGQFFFGQVEEVEHRNGKVCGGLLRSAPSKVASVVGKKLMLTVSDFSASQVAHSRRGGEFSEIEAPLFSNGLTTYTDVQAHL